LEMNMTSILVVDDDVASQRLLEFILRRHGYEVAVQGSGQAALDYLSANNDVDLAVLDITMSDMDGLTLLERIRGDARLQDLRVIMLTASGAESDRLKATSKGASGFLTKPVSSGQLIEAVQNILHRC
jgi:CheY-like chemotaxis protein